MVDVSILLPVYKPNLSWLHEQLKSLSEQTFKGFRCIVSHDGPLDTFETNQMCAALPDSRFQLVFSSEHLGTYKHVEYLISTFGLETIFFALCDQDDFWLPRKLESQMSKFDCSGVSAVSSNGLIVDDVLESIREKTTFDWFGITQRFGYFASVRNQLTGASGLFRSDRFFKAVPFPDNAGNAVHDHWLYIAALATGGIHFDPEPLWLYRQHKQNQIGASADISGFSRMIKGVTKILSILKNRYWLKDDTVLRQGKLFLDVACERWNSEKMSSDVLFQAVNRKERLGYLRPSILIGSSFESLRVAISKQK